MTASQQAYPLQNQVNTTITAPAAFADRGAAPDARNTLAGLTAPPSAASNVLATVFASAAETLG
ncbi:MAG: hypothetical protein ACI9WU_000438, partial [Myxococcota bacterium]